MPFYSGQQGQLIIDGARAAKVQNWTFQSSQAVLETTSLGDTDRTITPGTRSLAGSCRLFYYQDSAGKDGDVTKLIQKCMKPATPAGNGVAADSAAATMRLMINDGSVGGRFIEFQCYLTAISMSMSVGEVFAADVSFEANGAPTGLVI